ncbi:MAG: HNH endonuclease [Actinomycetota bacterium]|nr:HNH endonuclease [Actinomycetota bacterium]
MFLGVLSVPAVGATPRTPGPLPDTSLTPGAKDDNVTQENLALTICTPGYTKTITKVSTNTKSKVYVEYKVAKSDRSKFTIDHLIPLELGGSNDIRNLWLQRKKGDTGSSPKDRAENRLHSVVCAGTVTLADAQAAIVADWRSASKR